MLDIECLEKTCNCQISFNRKPSSGSWRLVSFVAHLTSCFIRSETEEFVITSAAYTPRQVARLVCAHIHEHPKLSTADFATIVKYTVIYTRNPTHRNYRAILAHIREKMAQTRDVDMDALENY